VRELGLLPFTTADLAGGIEWPASIDVGLVEGVGGPRSPISDDGDNVALAQLLAPDVVVLVADAGLGTINAVVLSCGPYAALGHDPIVALNRDDHEDVLHRRNRAWLTERWQLDVVVRATELGARLVASVDS